MAVTIEKWRLLCLYLQLECVVKCSKIINLIPDMPLSRVNTYWNLCSGSWGMSKWCVSSRLPAVLPWTCWASHDRVCTCRAQKVLSLELHTCTGWGSWASSAHRAALSSVCTGAGGCSGALLTTEAGHFAVSESHFFTKSLFLSSGLCLSTLRADSCWTGSCGEETGGKQKHFN